MGISGMKAFICSHVCSVHQISQEHSVEGLSCNLNSDGNYKYMTVPMPFNHGFRVPTVKQGWQAGLANVPNLLSETNEVIY